VVSGLRVDGDPPFVYTSNGLVFCENLDWWMRHNPVFKVEKSAEPYVEVYDKSSEVFFVYGLRQDGMLTSKEREKLLKGGSDVVSYGSTGRTIYNGRYFRNPDLADNLE
jgi:hypothetical protein